VLLDESSRANVGALALIRSVLGEAPAVASADSVANAYYGQGSHPDVVERGWDELGRAVPAQCRCLVHGTPALLHPTAGALLAFSLGTRYYVRRPSDRMPAGAEAAAGLGPAWSLGDWASVEPDWCAAVYAELEPGGPPAA